MIEAPDGQHLGPHLPYVDELGWWEQRKRAARYLIDAHAVEVGERAALARVGWRCPPIRYEGMPNGPERDGWRPQAAFTGRLFG